MENTLELFSAITTHLVSLTGYNEFGFPKSKGIRTYQDLADELNQEGILSTRNTEWTANSLECFFSRCRRKHTKAELYEQCPFELVGAEHHEYLGCEVRQKRPKIIRFKRTLHRKKYSH